MSIERSLLEWNAIRELFLITADPDKYGIPIWSTKNIGSCPSQLLPFRILTGHNADADECH